MDLNKIKHQIANVDKKALMGLGALFMVLAMAFPPLAIVFIIIAVALLGFGAKDLETIKKLFKK